MSDYDLSDSKLILETFLNNSIQAQFLLSKDGEIIKLNIAGRHFIKKFFKNNITSNTNWLDLISQFDSLLIHFNHAFTGDIVIKEIQLEDLFHNPIWYEFQYFPVFEETGDIRTILLTCVEINAHKIQQHDIQTRNELSYSILDHNPQSVLVLDKYLNIKYANPVTESIFDIHADNIMKTNIEAIFHRLTWEDRQVSLEEFKTSDLTNVPVEFKINNHNRKYFKITSRICYNERDFTINLYLDDVTELRSAQIDSSFLRNSIEESSVGIIILNSDGIILYFNNIINGLCQWCDELRVNASIFKICQNNSDEFLESVINSIHNQSQWRGKITSFGKDNRNHSFQVIVNLLKDPGGRIIRYIVIFRDITHELELEKQLRQAQKLEAIGTLAGGIAHDFNNILTAIMGFTELSLYDLDENDQMYSNINQILGASQRAKELIGQILTFSRQSEAQFRPIKLIPIIKESLKLLRASIPVTIDIEKRFNATCDSIIGDPTQIHQIVMNLSTNSYHAMKDKGGVLSISLEQLFVNPSDASDSVVTKAGEYLKLMIRDTGNGIPQNIISRIFDPYFTTKPIGEGTGLGLSMVHGIVSSMQGFIEVESKENTGTVFTIYFPAYIEINEVSEKENKIYKGNKQKILYVDDEVSITNIAKQILEKLNYCPFTCNDSEQALEIFLNNPDFYDMIITDMTMPKLTGIDLIQRIREISEHIPIILCTGYSDALSSKSIDEFKVNDYLLKPISIHELSLKIFKHIDKGRNANNNL